MRNHQSIAFHAVPGVCGILGVHAFNTATEASVALARVILRGVLDANRRGLYFLGLPTGSTADLIAGGLIRETGLLSDGDKACIAKRLHLVVMDDYAELDRNVNIDTAMEWSAVQFVLSHVITPLNSVIKPYALHPDRVLRPMVGRVGALRDYIIGIGGLDLQVIATDPYEGHVAQNFPNQGLKKGEDEKLGTLSAEFLRHHPEACMLRGITFDLQDFIDMVAANEGGRFVFLLAGQHKRLTFSRFIAERNYNPTIPVSFLWKVADRTMVYIDRAAAGALDSLVGAESQEQERDHGNRRTSGSEGDDP